MPHQSHVQLTINFNDLDFDAKERNKKAQELVVV